METKFAQRVSVFCSFLPGISKIEYADILCLPPKYTKEWARIIIPSRWWFPHVIAEFQMCDHRCYGKISEEKILFVRVKDWSVLSRLQRAALRYSEEIGESVIII